ncbi:RloB family protein [Microvirga soli]|uniref:RloB family protein n=1 Tax=Microvirga soli TaxID=1854496 RepID=UPI00191E3B81|nr:RloB family protein [Microvirga soli]
MSRRIPSLSRPAAKVTPKKKFILYCEGKNTEPDYFNALKVLFKGTLVEVEAIGAVGDPSKIAETASDRAQEMGLTRGSRKKRDSFEEKDEIWAVFDRDEHPHFDQALRVCEGKGINVARSNPCFEIWLILHFDDFHKPHDRHEVQKHLKSLCAQYDPSKGKTLDCAAVLKDLAKAQDRAERQLKRREEEGVPYGAPSTTVFQLTRKIAEAATQKK